MTARREQASEWMHFAGEDLRATELLYKEGIYSLTCFHAQQCAEKVLKAMIVLRGGNFKRIHDLNELLECCRDSGENGLDIFEEKLAVLNSFYAPMRYPDGIPGSLADRIPSKMDAKEAMKIAEQIHDAALKIISRL